VEDSGLGVALVSELNERRFTALAVKVEYNKHTRMAIQSPKFESGRVYLPRSSDWLEELESELFAFPVSRYDDQVDSISQTLAHEIQGSHWDTKSIEGLSKLTEAPAWDQQFARLAGRPW
jgi:predicted phage terminase large subunit-like protein